MLYPITGSTSDQRLATRLLAQVSAFINGKACFFLLLFLKADKDKQNISRLMRYEGMNLFSSHHI